MSLRETYQSRKNLLAANLTQQGVTASGSEGLTTLINKVLEISPAPPTPVLDHFDVELVDGKKILSYADEQKTPHSQYASLLFTAYDSNDDPIPGLEFDFSVTGESTVSAVCDNNGEYVYTYYSQGIGDVEITASKEVSGSVVSKTYDIRDAILHKSGTANQSSQYEYDIGTTGDVEITTVASATSQGFNLIFGTPNDAYCSVGVGGARKLTTYNKASGGSQYQSELIPYSYNTQYTEVLTRKGDSITQTINGSKVTDTSITGMNHGTKLFCTVWNSLTVTYEITVMPL